MGKRDQNRKVAAKPKVAIGYCHPDMISAYFHGSLVALIRSEARVGQVIGVFSSPKIDEARNAIVHTFLRETDATHLLMVDTDMVLPRDTVQRLLAADKDIVSGLAFVGTPERTPVRPNIVVRHTNPDETWYLAPLWDYPPGELVKVAGCGAACMMVKREVYEGVLKARGEDHPFPWFAHGMANNTPIGEDVAFCLTAQVVGYEVWCDTGLVVPHVKSRLVDEASYVLSLNMEGHPHYTDRESVPIYKEMVGSGDTSLHDN